MFALYIFVLLFLLVDTFHFRFPFAISFSISNWEINGGTRPKASTRRLIKKQVYLYFALKDSRHTNICFFCIAFVYQVAIQFDNGSPHGGKPTC